MVKIRLSMFRALCFVICVLCPHVLLAANMEGIQIIETLPDGLVIRYEMPELETETKAAEGQTFQHVSFKDCNFTYEIGKAQLPIKVISLGIPEISNPNISAQSIKTTIYNGYKLYPVEKPIVYRDTDIQTSNDESGFSDNQHSAGTEFTMDRDFYRTHKFYPDDLAKIEPVGYIRQQRIARLELHPIQYDPVTSQLKIHKTIDIRVTFNSPVALAPSRNNNIQISNTGDHSAFEELYRDMILNYDQAKNWRRQRSRQSTTSMAPGLSTVASSKPGEQGTWYKISIEENGIYKLDYDYLVRAGIDTEDIDPRKIIIMSSGEQIPIYVEGYDDGKFDPDDYIEFYGIQMDSHYTKVNIYWLSWGALGSPDTKSMLMPVKDGTPMSGNSVALDAFWDVEHWEEDIRYDPLKEVTSETADHLFWTQMRGNDPDKNNSDKYIALELPYKAYLPHNPAKLRVAFHGSTYARGASSHRVNIVLNDKTIGMAEWEGQTEFIFEKEISQGDLRRLNHFYLYCMDDNDTHEKVKYDPRYTGPEWDVFLNWIEIDYWREFRAHNNRVEFSTETSPSITMLPTYSITEFTGPNIEIFQIDRSGAIAKIINPEVNKEDTRYTARFQDKVLQPTRYIAINAALSHKPLSIARDESSTLHDPANRADYIMITHKNFRESTERLAEFRRKQGLEVIVVDIDDIYDEFSYGIFDPKSIKRFLRYAYFNWDIIPTYVLLMGDAHWDYKYVKHQYYVKYDTYPYIYVPTYHAPSSPYGESAVDHKFVAVSGDDVLPDMFLGRIPAESAEEADGVVDKIIRYESDPHRGQWQSRVLLAADDEKSKSGDEVFEDSRRFLVENSIPVGYEVAEVYLREVGEPYIARSMISTELNKGVVVAEYSGHGGIHYWAHEGIFHVADVEKMQNYNKYPFVITTTCENGYFDNPMSKSIMEVFLEEPRSGAIACLSATRLTYGQGNAAFDKILYPKIFSENPPILGKIITEAKIDFINLNMIAWIGSAEQYTLFGDPATKLALPELDIECKLASTVIDSSKSLVLKSGTVRKRKLNKATGEEELVLDAGFNADLKISVEYPNNFDEIESNDLPIQDKTIKVWEGVFGEVSLPVLKGVIPGEGKLRCYANDGRVSAAGGVRFSMSRPVIESYSSEIVDEEKLAIYAAVIDNIGSAGIKSVICEWKDSVTWRQHFNEMKLGQAPPGAPEVEGLWYNLVENIPLSKPGSYIDYKISVLDVESDEPVTSTLERVRVPVGTNLAVTRTGPSLLPDISYSYSLDEGSWQLEAGIENNGGKLVKQPIAVYFFEGSPDRNRDDVVDIGAEVLGYTIVEYSEMDEGVDPGPGYWRSGGDVLQVADVFIKLEKPLYSGSHQIFVWVNPKTGSLHNIPGITRVEDAEKSDDKTSKLFEINEFVVGRGTEPTQVQSLDGVLAMEVPSDSVDETIMSIAKLAPPESEWQQPDVSLAPIPEQGLDGGAFKIQLASGDTSLNKTAKVSIRFDATAMRRLSKKAKGLADKADSELTKTELEWIELATQMEARKLALFAWQEDIGSWQYVPSELLASRSSLVKDDETIPFMQDPYVTLPMTQNHSDFELNTGNVVVDEIITPIGDWVIFFIDTNSYRVYLRREGTTGYEKLKHGQVGEAYYSDDVGLTLKMNIGQKEYRYGDIFKFRTYQNTNGVIKLADLRHSNSGDGTARITIMPEEEYNNTTYTVGEWSIFFISNKNFEIHSSSGLEVKDSLGYIILGELGREILIPSIGVKIALHAGRWEYKFGDRIVFKTLFTGMINAEIDQLETMTLMHNNDQDPPDIQVWINKQVPQDGTVVAPRPDISLLLSDANGIDISSLTFELSINDRDFFPIESEDYMFSERVQGSSFVTNVPIFYSPVLNIGKYRYRIDVGDFTGNSAMSETGNYLEFMFLVEEQPDMAPPEINAFINDSETLTDGYVFEESSPEFLIDIHDGYLLDPSTINLFFGPVGELSEPLEESEYEITFSEDIKDAEIIYRSHLMNGEYAIQVQATDTSSNTGYLSPPEVGQIRFSIDEEVDIGRVVNMPNPFSDKTVFSYSLTQPADNVTIKIYTVRGRLVKTLVQDSPGWLYNEEFWDGRDEDGSKLGNGAYLYKFVLTADNKKIEKIGKLAIVR